MKVLVVHDSQSADQDFLVLREIRSLRDSGHQLIEYLRNADSVTPVGRFDNLVAVGRAMWSLKTYRDIRALILEHRPDAAFIYNTFPAISPSAYYACVDYEIPVVHGLRDLNLFPPNRETTLRSARAGFWCTAAQALGLPYSSHRPASERTSTPDESAAYSARHVVSRAVRLIFQ